MLFFFAFQSPPEQMRDGQTLGEKSFVMKMINILERKIEQELGVRRVNLFTYIVNCHFTFFCIFLNFKELLYEIRFSQNCKYNALFYKERGK